MNRNLIFNTLKFALSDVGDPETLAGITAEDWEYIRAMLNMHGLSGLACEVIERMPEALRPPQPIIMKYIAANVVAIQSYSRLKSLAGKIDSVMKENDLKCLLLKGLSLADYYPKPESRRFLDIDIYAPGSESRVDKAFMAKGVSVDTDFYRHSHMSLGGILVENHHFLLDVRGRQRLAELDADLKSIALTHLKSFDGPGLYYPDAIFSLIFNLHHAMSHFIYEGISFKFLVDWIYFLRRDHLTVNQGALALERHGLLKFAAVMSEVSVRHLGLNVEHVPECIRKEMVTLNPLVVDRFIDDLFRPYEKVHQKNLVAERLHNVRRIIKTSWKSKEFLGQSAFGFVWDKFLPILMGKKFEAD